MTIVRPSQPVIQSSESMQTLLLNTVIYMQKPITKPL